MQATVYRFQRFELQPDAQQLLLDGAPVRLGGRAFDLLQVLVENRHRVVAREELFERVWAGRVVEDQNLRVQVNTLRKVLGDAAIATVPGRGYRFVLPLAGDAATASPAAPTTPAPPPSEAPPVSDLPTLYGRVADIAQACQLVGEHRLVTIVGAGGIGKTKLAQAVAHQLGHRFRDGVWLVELAALADADALPSTLAHALALPGSDGAASTTALTRTLRGLELLIVLDNCEHLSVAVAPLARALLQGAPRLHLLATSQEPLRAVGEQVFRLGPLDTPPTGSPRPLLDSGAAALFVARVRAADARFAVDAGNADAIADICRQLDGIPLALELAAARVPLLGVHGVRQRLDQQLQLLRGGPRDAPARQRTVRGALEWSATLLAPAERAALARLGPFCGSFSAAEAQHVIAGLGGACADAWEALDLLSVLFDKSLVHAAPPAAGEPRYRLLESTRAYALELLAGDEAAARRCHAAAMRARFEAADGRFLATPSGAWLDGVLPDIDNLREAFRWAQAAGERELAVALAASSAALWNLSGHVREGAAMCQTALALAEGVPPRVKARLALAVAQYGAAGVGAATPAAALAAARQAAEAYRTLGDPLHVYWATHFVIPLAERAGEPIDVEGELAAMQALERSDWPPLRLRLRRAGQARQLGRRGDWAAYRDAFRDEAQRLAALGEWRGSWFAAQSQALAELQLGRPQEAVAALQPVVAQIRAHGRLRQTWTPLGLMTAGLVESGDLDGAAVALRELVPLMQAEGSVAWGIDHASLFLVLRGAWETAALVHGWSNAVAAQRAEQRGPGIREAHARVATRLRQHFDEAALTRLLERGAALDEDGVAERVRQAC
jgi:predicted ATPase/DNA-binding winged helix-turn-helix (wHTH) protein